MSKTQAMTRREQQPVAKRNATMQEYLEQVLPKLDEVAPKGFDMAAFIPKFLQRAQRNPQLLACTHASIYLALHESLQLGLEALSPHGHYWLVPRRNRLNGNALEACGQLGYKGMIELAMRSGRVRKIDVELIYEGEEFHYDRATGEIHHPFKFGVDKRPERIIGGYASAELSTGGRVTRVCERADFDKSAALAQSDKFWKPYYAEMSMGVCVKRLFGRGQVPMTPELAEQIDRETEREKAAEWSEIEVATTVPASLPEPRQDPLPQPDPVPGWGDDEVPQNAPQDATEEMPSGATEDSAVRLDLENRILEACANLRLSVGGNKSWLASEMRRRWKAELLSEMDVPALETLCGELEARVP